MLPVRIVVADDSCVYRTALCDFLQHIPDISVVAVAQDGAEALRLVQEAAPDLLLLDIEMPDVDGWEVLRQLRDTEAAVRVVVLSSHTDPYTQQRAVDGGASAYVPKGDIQLLVATLRQLL
jgi:two-component system response regulator DesR